MEDATPSGTVSVLRSNPYRHWIWRRRNVRRSSRISRKFPLHWVKALEQAKSINAYRLALRIQLEAFQRDRIGGEIVLSAEMTGMSRPIGTEQQRN